MKKLSMIAAAVAFTGFSSMAQAVSEPTCYVPVHGLFPDGSINSIDLPIMTTSSRAYVEVYIKNVSKKPLNIKAYLYDWDGYRITPENKEILDDFDLPYDPLLPEKTSGILFPGNVGTFKFNTTEEQRLQGSIRWQADACLDEAIQVTMRNSFFNSNGVLKEGNLFMLNNGNAF